MLERAKQELDIAFNNQLQSFQARDPFNPENVLQGYISHVPDYRYGALVLTHVNDVACYQIVFGTPKLFYPFARGSKELLFPAWRRVDVFEKLDGTNVLAFQYRVGGKVFTSYKPRKTAMLMDKRHGPFLSLWKKVLARRPEVAEVCVANGHPVSLELFGSENTHNILYSHDIDVRVLFGVRGAKDVVPGDALHTLGLPTPQKMCTLLPDENINERYRAMQSDLESRLVRVGESTFTGIEGTVWYVTKESGEVIMVKCKPPSIEQDHWTMYNNRQGIDEEIIRATALNVLEEGELTIEATTTLLAEEFDEDQVDRSRERVRVVVNKLRDELVLRERVLAEYRKLGVSLVEDKRRVMQELGKCFPKDVMGFVYAVLAEMEKMS